MVNEKRLLEEFFEIVQIDSETKFEGKIVKVLRDKLTKLGLEVFEDDTASVTKHEAGNLFGFLKGNVEGADPIMFNAHMDTVTPGVGIKPSVKDGWIVSDGKTILGGDDKAGIASLIEVAAMNHRLKLMGYNAAEDFTNQLDQFIATRSK